MSIRSLEDTVLAGWSELPVRKRTEHSTATLLAQATHGALRHAGMTPRDVDGFAVGGFTLAPDHEVDLAAGMGLHVRWLAPQEPGGAGALGAVTAAAEAVRSGTAEVVVCAAADRTDPASLRALNADFSTVFAQCLQPVGAAAPNVVFALIQDQHARRYGTTRRELGALAVAQRRNGTANPATLFPEPLTVGEYLAARPVVEPLHLYDCVLPGCGAAAVVVTSRNRAPQGVRLVNAVTVHNPDEHDPLRFGWYRHADALYDHAGIGPGEFSGAQLYDDYPIMVALQLEELGFCQRGRSGRFCAETDFTPRGELPLNTGGGMLACGQAGAAGGYLPLLEAARQLAGQAGRRQLTRPASMLVSGLGMVGYTRPRSLGAAILRAAA